MKIVELNRCVTSLKRQGQTPEEIADFLEYVVADAATNDDSEESALCREHMQELFSDPVARAKMYIRLTMSACREEPEDDDEDANAVEANFFMTEMLKAIMQALEAGSSLAECKAMIQGILAEG